MRNYYYCEANSMVYTEKEKINSVWPAGRFMLIGAFKSRSDAEVSFGEKNYNIYINYSDERRK